MFARIVAFAIAFAACGPGRTVPRLTTTNPGDAATAPDPDEPPPSPARPPPGDNVYVCSCIIQVPPLCRPSWCGDFGTGTQVLPADGFCDLGLRDARVCYPAALNPRSVVAPPGAHAPSYAELAADCVGRVAWVVGAGARRALGEGCGGAYGEGPCAVRWGCSAVRVDGAVATAHDDACDAACPHVDLVQVTPGHWNLEEATYLSTLNQWLCDGATDTPETPVVCHR